jgi:xanthine dehydrogenase YagT iron-sulfur-binding subunit
MSDDSVKTPKKLSRRDFLKVSGGSAVGAAVITPLVGKASAAVPTEAEVFKGFAPIQLNVNGKLRRLEVEPRTTLLSALRNKLDVTGCKEVCDRGECGACTVLMNGKPVLACMTLALDAIGKEITTVEGLATAGKLDPVQQAFVEKDALMCGFCTPGMIMSAKALLDENPKPSRNEIIHHMDGNICRCTGYVPIVTAIQRAAEAMTKEIKK